MPDGSTAARPSAISTTVTTTTTTHTRIPSFTLKASRPATARHSSPLQPAPAMKAMIFGPTSPTGVRPRTGHQSIRGRISGPIPIPTNNIDDDEFPIRNPGTGIASPTPITDGEEALELPQPPPPLPPASPAAASFHAPIVPAGRVDIPQAAPLHTGPSPPPHSHPHSSVPTVSGPSPEGGTSRSSRVGNPYPRTHRTNPSSTTRYSTVSAASNNTGPSSLDHTNSPPQRKKSTLRSALTKFLRRRKKDGPGSLSSVSEADRKSAYVQPSPHRSVPPIVRAKESESKRSVSLPITEFDRALRSHSVGPDDITAIESARNSVQVDTVASSPLRRRANTATSSKLFIGTRRQDEWSGLSPRPASTHGRGSRFTEEDPDEIGRAITSDAPGSELAHKRRSRSLSGIRDLADRRHSRRRSDEIRYWRESYDVPGGALSPLSSDNNDFPEDMGGRRSMSVSENVADRPPKTPPQPFTFGTIASMSEMAGMKITHAASLDMRFGSLEARVHKLERVVDQLCHSVPGFKSPLMEFAERSGARPQHVPASQPAFAYSNAAPPMIPTIYQIQARGNQTSDSRYTAASRRSEDTDGTGRMSFDEGQSFGEGRTYIDSLHPPSSSATQNARCTTAVSGPPMLLRPTSESTVRPATSMPSLGSQHSDEQPANTLLAQLEAERAARLALETQVKKLSDRMNNLSTTMFAMVRDPAKSRSSERLRPTTSSGPTPTSTSPAQAPISIIAHPNKAESGFDNDSDSPMHEDFSDSFQTPCETPNAAYGAFGEELRDEEEEDPKRKKAARTLSLSQLTYGKPVSARS